MVYAPKYPAKNVTATKHVTSRNWNLPVSTKRERAAAMAVPTRIKHHTQALTKSPPQQSTSTPKSGGIIKWPTCRWSQQKPRHWWSRPIIIHCLHWRPRFPREPPYFTPLMNHSRTPQDHDRPTVIPSLRGLGSERERQRGWRRNWHGGMGLALRYADHVDENQGQDTDDKNR